MAGFGDAIKYLYSQFILRDVLSFITPGAIVVFTALFLFYREVFSYSIHWLLYIPLFGLLFMVGFAVQCLGEIIGLISTQQLAKSSLRQRLKTFLWNWVDKSSDIIWWEQIHKETVEFMEASCEKEWAQQQRERLVVLKQMCGNGSMSILIAGILLALSRCQCEWVQYAVLSLMVLVLLASLFWGHRIHILRQGTMVKAILCKL